MSPTAKPAHAPIVCRFAADDIAEEWQRPAPQPIPSGIEPLDRALDGGFMAESLAVLCAGTGRGKTGLVIQIARGWLLQNRPVLFIETEMSRRQTLARFLAQQLHQPWRRVFDMEPSSADSLATLAKEQLQRLCVVRWQPSQTIAEIVEAFSGLCSVPPLVVVDQLSDLARAQGTQDMRLATARVTGDLKALAEQLQTVILAVSQTARAVTSEFGPKRKGRGFEGAAKDAGEVEMDASTLLYLDSEPCRRNGTGKSKLHISKSRGGPCDEVVDLLFHGAIGTFEAVAAEDPRHADQAMLEAIEKLGPSVGVKKLAKHLRIGQATAERGLDALAQAGLIIRSPVGASLTPNRDGRCR